MADPFDQAQDESDLFERAGGGDDEEEDGDGASDRREIGKLAVWSVSTAKPGNGVEFLRDNSLDTYWQSDGAQPHTISIQFQKKVRLQQLALYVNFKRDESYTPNKLTILAGNSFRDLKEIKSLHLVEPEGWVYTSLRPRHSRDYLRAYLLQIIIVGNHQNGRDTHLRQVKVYGPRQNTVRAVGLPLGFSSLEFSMYSTIR